MDSTAQRLEKMNGTQFEQLCGPVVRQMVPELRHFIPSGINSQGEVIKSLSDGFCFIHPRCYATVHVTVNDSNLRKKWLYDGDAQTTNKGDLIKSICQAREMYKEKKGFQFRVFLVTNHVVDEKIHRLVNDTVKDEFITVQIIEQRELVLFLDHDPEGQYLRYQYFGIEALRISASLLKEISEKNLALYATEIYLEKSLLAYTASQQKVMDKLERSEKTVNLLTGSSGFGKSTLCYAVMENFFAEGKPVLRLQPSVIEDTASLKSAIKAQLIYDHPGVYVNENDIDQLFQYALLIIDDINKSGKTQLLLDKIISWNTRREDSSVCILCPVWPQNLKKLDSSIQKQGRFSLIALDSFSFSDCKSIITQRINIDATRLTDQEIHAIIIDTGYDPLLINFSLELLKQETIFDPGVPRQAIEKYINDQLNQVSEDFEFFEIKNALVMLGQRMLENGRLNPRINEIGKWLEKATGALNIIRKIALRKKLILFNDQGDIQFRHDRVRDQILIMSVNEWVKDFVLHQGVFGEPYYAEIVGAALAFSESNHELNGYLLENNPLAVFFSLKFLQDESQKRKREIIIEAIIQWIASEKVESLPVALTTSIAGIFLLFDVMEIEEITKGFPDKAELDMARFRNGNWLQGIIFLSKMDYYYPEGAVYGWKSILGHVKANHAGKIADELSKALPATFTASGIFHAYTFAGYLGNRAMLPALIDNWIQKSRSPNNYPAYLWAILNSSAKEDVSILNETLAYWGGLSAEEKSYKLMYADTSTPTLRQVIIATEWEFSKDILAFLLDAGKKDIFKEIAALLLAKIDHPEALAIVLDNEMHTGKEPHQDDDVTIRWDRAGTSRRLGILSLDYLFSEFSNPENLPRRRYLAWRYWHSQVEVAEGIRLLQKLPVSNDRIFENMLCWRMTHGDSTVFEFLPRLVQNSPRTVVLFADIWDEPVEQLFLDWMEKQLQGSNSNNIFFGLETLKCIDNEMASDILSLYWDKIKDADNSIETALFLGTNKSLQLADEEIKRLGFDEKVVMHEFYRKNLTGMYVVTGGEINEERKNKLLRLARHFRRLSIYYGRRYAGPPTRISKRRIENLIPYLSLCDERTILHFAKICLRMGERDLCFNNFYPLLPKHLKSQIRYSYEDVKEDVERAYRQISTIGDVSALHWIENPERLGITPEMISMVIRSLWKLYPGEHSFLLIAQILERAGCRSDIILIEEFFQDFKQPSPQIQKARANTIFRIKRRSLE